MFRKRVPSKCIRRTIITRT